MPEISSKDLLQLEGNSTICSSDSSLEPKLFVCNKHNKVSLPEVPIQKPTMCPVPRSQVLGRALDFLGVISESNKKLLHDAKDNPENYDIEVLSGKESEVIEMDLMLGVADLHTPEAVAAAESAMSGYQPANHFLESSSEGESEDSDKDDDDEKKDDKMNKHDIEKQIERQEVERNSSGKKPRKQKARRPSKIVELS